uniref:Exodeoxyribonuclease iii n=1 Tax=Tetraselmis sp. GSL018 TaxID=582737 RepID=A0A061SGZ1_9CHLO
MDRRLRSPAEPTIEKTECFITASRYQTGSSEDVPNTESLQAPEAETPLPIPPPPNVRWCSWLLHPPLDTVAYTYWSYMRNMRAKNKGWRIDYTLVSRELLHCCSDSFVLPHIEGSDHCPVGLILRP